MRSVRIAAIAAVAIALVGGCSKSTSGSGTAGTGDAIKNAPDNGVAALAPAEILAKVQAALPKVSSVHISGGGVSDGQKVALDVKIKGTQGSAGTLSIPIGSDSTSSTIKLDFIVIGKDAYIKGDDTFWKTLAPSSPLSAAQLQGKWLKGSPDSERLKPLLTFGDLTSLSTELLKPDGKLTKGAAKDIHGTKTIGLVDSGANGGTLYISTQGEPLPVQISQDKGATTIDFTDYGKPVELTAPPADQLVTEQQVGLTAGG